MTASSVAAAIDRSELRHVLVSGTKAGFIAAGAVVLTLAVHRSAVAGLTREALVTSIVVLAGAALSLLPGRWAAARTAEGVAGAAAIGLWGTVVFMAFDIVVLRPLKAYPWTWDAVGGGSTWWYLPIWWMLGTYLAWMGGLLTAARARRGATGLAGAALPLVAGALVVAGLATALGAAARFAVAAGAGLTATLTVLAVAAVARRR